jgi:hypothetical protein
MRKKLIRKKNERDIPRLYKYSNIEGACASLKNLTLRFKAPNQFNDPFEFSVGGIEEATDDQIKLFYQKEGIPEDTPTENFNDFFKSEGQKILAKQADVLNACIRVSCFSTNILNILMWAHYAEEHKGIVIEYDVNRILRRCMDNDMSIGLQEVEYSNIKPKIKNLLIITDQERNKEMAKIAGTKSNDWRYEKEWRLILINADYEKAKSEGFIRDIPFYPNEIKGIYFGGKCEENTIKAIQETCLRQHIECPMYQIQFSSSSYEINYHKIHQL